jgi:hypothetical protein
MVMMVEESMMNIIGKYKNGNYSVSIWSDGTKVRETEDCKFIPTFAECCDVKITDKCDGGCAFCYEGCTANGKHGDLNAEFLNHLHPYTELAINGNDLTHPDLIPFFKCMKEQKVIVSMTVNQKHFERNYDLIKKMSMKGWIHGVGISLNEATEDFIKLVKSTPNTVIHVINGIITPEEVKLLSDNHLKMLILGYKRLRRGEEYYIKEENNILSNQQWMKDNISKIINHFDVVSFDNLSIKQLDIRRLLTDAEWEEFFMGEDSEFTFYIDLVAKKFAKNSLATERFDLMDNIDDMFNKIRYKKEQKQ